MRLAGGTKLALGFLASWSWLPLLLAACVSGRALGAAFAVAGFAALGGAVALSLARERSVRIPTLAGLSFALVLASALAPVRLGAADSLAEVGFGYPVRFVFADLSVFGTVGADYGTVVSWDPLEHPERTDGLLLLASWLLVFGGLAALLWGLPAAGRRLAAARAPRALPVAQGLRPLPVLGGLALGLVLASSLAPVAVGADEPYSRIGFGYPVHFLSADLTFSDALRERRGVEYWDPAWDPAQVHELRLLASWLAVLALLAAAAWGARAARQRLGGAPRQEGRIMRITH